MLFPPFFVVLYSKQLSCPVREGSSLDRTDRETGDDISLEKGVGAGDRYDDEHDQHHPQGLGRGAHGLLDRGGAERRAHAVEIMFFYSMPSTINMALLEILNIFQQLTQFRSRLHMLNM